MPPRGTVYAQHITASPPGFENLTVSLFSTSIYLSVDSLNPKHGQKQARKGFRPISVSQIFLGTL